jgi:hypothetical protein
MFLIWGENMNEDKQKLCTVCKTQLEQQRLGLDIVRYCRNCERVILCLR